MRHIAHFEEYPGSAPMGSMVDCQVATEGDQRGFVLGLVVETELGVGD